MNDDRDKRIKKLSIMAAIMFIFYIAGLWAATRLMYIADEETESFYRGKAQQARRRGRRHPAKKKNDPAK